MSSSKEKFADKNRDEPLHLLSREKRWKWQRWHLWLLIIGLLIRVVYGLMVSREASFGGWDGKEYYAYAHSLLAFQGDAYPRYFNSIRPPFYPIFLIPFIILKDNSVWHIQLAQAGLGVLQAFVLAKIAGRWRGQRAGNWAFALALFHPFLIYFCAFVLTETIFILLLWCGIGCLQRVNDPKLDSATGWLTLSAASLALGCLTRAPLQLFLIVAVFWIGWRTLALKGWKIALQRMAYFTLVVSLLLLPWMIYNLRTHGEFTLAPGGGQAMYTLSNSPDYLHVFEATTKDEYYQAQDRMTRRISAEEKSSLEAWAAEVETWRQTHKADWLRLQWYKFKHFWTPWLNPVIFSRANFLMSVVSAAPLFLLAPVELWRRRKLRDPFLILLLGLIGVGYLVGGFLFHVQIRYRIPYVDISFLLLTASLLSSFSFKKLSEWKLRIPLLKSSEHIQA